MRRELLIEKYINPTEVIFKGLAKHWYNKYGETHSFNDQPAVVHYFKAGNKSIEFFFKKGIMNRRRNKPTYISYFYGGEPACMQWHKDGVLIKSKHFCKDLRKI